MAQIVQILCQATFAPAQKDSSSEVVEQSVMVILSFLVLILYFHFWVKLALWRDESSNQLGRVTNQPFYT